MKKLLTGALAGGVFTLSFALLPSNALAFSVVGCSTPILGETQSPLNLNDNVTNTTSCQYVTPPTNNTNDQGANGLDINALTPSGFFGITDWIQNTDYFENVNAQTGAFDLSTITFDSIADWTKASEILLVLKDGNNTSTLVGYLYDMTKNGTFSVLTNPWGELYGKNKDISHISVYYREGTTPIPTPALLPGAIGMGIAALRRKKREQGLEEATQEA